MFGNSLSGSWALLGETVTLRVVVSETYSTATGKVTRALLDQPIPGCRKRGLTASDRRRLGGALAEQTTDLIVVPASSIRDGTWVPLPRTKLEITNAATGDVETWEVLAVSHRTAAGVPISYELQVTGR